MTFDQENAMTAILKAVNDALQAGLTKGQIISEIENEGMHGFQRSRPPSATDTPRRYGWSPAVDKNRK